MTVPDPTPAAPSTPAAHARRRFTRRQEALTISWLRSLGRSSTGPAAGAAGPETRGPAAGDDDPGEPA